MIILEYFNDRIVIGIDKTWFADVYIKILKY